MRTRLPQEEEEIEKPGYSDFEGLP
jgi:hypothetical protein